MKFTLSIRNATLLFFLFSLSLVTNAQRITFNDPTGTDSLFTFEALNLPISDADAYYSHLWWFGDNGFSFEERPNYAYQKWDIDPVNAISITTENYGTGGPPPMVTDPTPDPTTGNPQPARILTSGNSIYIQHYRNAVLNDTMYLIVTYALPDNLPLTIANGELRLQLDPNTTLLSDFLDSVSEFTPNGEILTSTNKLKFTNLVKGQERSVLIPLKTNNRAEETVKFGVELSIQGNDTIEFPPSEGTAFIERVIPVAKSHDPNQMIESSDAKNNCNFGGEQINYRVQFQNTGDTTTHFISVTSYLDENIDMNSISNVVLPSKYLPNQIVEGPLNHRYAANKGAIYYIDKTNRTITFELNDLILRSTEDPMCKNLSRTRSEIQFSVLVKPNFTFGDPIIAHSSIIFDANEAMATNTVYTTCDNPESEGLGCEHQCEKPNQIAKNCCWIYITIAVLILILILVLIVLIITIKRNKKK